MGSLSPSVAHQQFGSNGQIPPPAVGKIDICYISSPPQLCFIRGRYHRIALASQANNRYNSCMSQKCTTGSWT